MILRKLLLSIFFALSLAACGDDSPKVVSILNLLVHGEQYDGQKLVTSGYFVNEFENVALYISSEQAHLGGVENGLSVEFDKNVNWQADISNLDSPITAVSNTYLWVEGIYSRRQSDYPGEFGGYIHVTRVIQSRPMN